MPADPDFHDQKSFITVFGILPRLLAASLIAFWAGEFANSYTMARLKILTRGRWLWTRTVGSTVVGQAVDTTIVIILTFAGTYPAHTLARLIVTSYCMKVAYEILATPLTYLVVNFLKRAENSDDLRRPHQLQPLHLLRLQITKLTLPSPASHPLQRIFTLKPPPAPSCPTSPSSPQPHTCSAENPAAPHPDPAPSGPPHTAE